MRLRPAQRSVRRRPVSHPDRFPVPARFRLSMSLDCVPRLRFTIECVHQRVALVGGASLVGGEVIPRGNPVSNCVRKRKTRAFCTGETVSSGNGSAARPTDIVNSQRTDPKGQGGRGDCQGDRAGGGPVSASGPQHCLGGQAMIHESLDSSPESAATSGGTRSITWSLRPPR